MRRFVAVSVEGEVQVHLPDAVGSYATLCGLDGDDKHKSVMQSVSKVPRGQKVNCQQCKLIWEVAKRYRAADFED